MVMQRSPVASHPVDESPYGLIDMAGNTSDWCADRFSVDGARVQPDGRISPDQSLPAQDESMFVRRGGSWDATEGRLRVTSRNCDKSTFKSFFLGIRLVRSLH